MAKERCFWVTRGRNYPALYLIWEAGNTLKYDGEDWEGGKHNTPICATFWNKIIRRLKLRCGQGAKVTVTDHPTKKNAVIMEFELIKQKKE